jgi:hypothetical protein
LISTAIEVGGAAGAAVAGCGADAPEATTPAGDAAGSAGGALAAGFTGGAVAC